MHRKRQKVIMLIVFSKCFSVGRVDETLFVFLQASIGGAIRKLKFGNQSYTQKESFRYEADMKLVREDLDSAGIAGRTEV